MRLVFLDTVGLIALWDVADQWHERAMQAYDLLKKGPFVAITTSYVLLECANAAARRPYRELLVKLRQDLLKQHMLFDPNESDVAEAWSVYDVNRPGTASVIDLTSFAVMKRLGVSEAFTNDRHFQSGGFTTLF
jgi:uncharacterized protein